MSQTYFQSFFSRDEFAQRRQCVAAEIGPGAVAVLQGAPDTGGFTVFRQTNEFFYLTGVEVPHAYVLIKGGSGETTLYLPPCDSKREHSEGAMLHSDAPEQARATTGVQQVKPLTALSADLAEAESIWTPLAPAEGRQVCRDTAVAADKMRREDPFEDPRSREERFKSALAGAAPKARIADLSPILDELRILKSPAEIQCMRAAGRLSAQAVTRAMRATRAGLMEFHLAAEADYVFAMNGAAGQSYRPIIACGANIWNAHYYRNNSPLTAGELVLMDCAPDYCCYTSDIGRIWPVNGTYASWQRELYGFVVEYHKVLLAEIRPGLSAAQVMENSAQRMAAIIAARTWSRPEFKNAALQMLRFQGHLSHGVGMTVHDAGNYKKAPLRPGVVFALDPQMWVHEAKLYIRVEDTVAVTDNGCESLTSDAPLELSDVESVMRSAGVAQ